MRTLLVVLVSLMAAATTLLPAPAAQAALTTSFLATIKGSSDFSATRGEAKASVVSKEVTFDLKMTKVPRSAGTKLKVFVDNTEIGTIRISKTGAGTLHLKNKTIPIIEKNMSIEIKKNNDDGDQVASGTFKRQ